MSLKAKRAMWSIKKHVAALRPAPPTPAPPPSRAFRPMTPDPYKVRIPKIRKVRAYHTRVEPMTMFLLKLPVREKKEIKRVAEELGVSQSTILRLAYKRFLRMPEIPLSPKQLRAWHMGIQRDKKSWRRKEQMAFKKELMEDLDAHDRLGTGHLQDKLTEVMSTNGYYRKPKRVVFRPGLRKGKEGNPSGRNGRVPENVQHVPDYVGTPEPDGDPVATVADVARPVRLIPRGRRLMIKQKGK